MRHCHRFFPTQIVKAKDGDLYLIERISRNDYLKGVVAYIAVLWDKQRGRYGGAKFVFDEALLYRTNLKFDR